MLFAKIKQHYEAVVAVCCFLILFTNVGLPSTSFSVYQPYLVGLPGFLTEAFGTYLVSYASLLAMLVVAAIIVIGVYTATDKRANPDA